MILCLPPTLAHWAQSRSTITYLTTLLTTATILRMQLTENPEQTWLSMSMSMSKVFCHWCTQILNGQFHLSFVLSRRIWLVQQKMLRSSVNSEWVEFGFGWVGLVGLPVLQLTGGPIREAVAPVRMCQTTSIGTLSYTNTNHKYTNTNTNTDTNRPPPLALCHIYI